MERIAEKWARPDLDWRPSGYQPDAPTRLSYGPARPPNLMNRLKRSPRTARIHNSSRPFRPPTPATNRSPRGNNRPETLIITTPNRTAWEDMEALEAIKSVKSVSKYKPDPVPEQKVQAVMNAARLPDSAGNLQPWKFIVVSDEDTKRQLAGACTNAKHMADAPLVVVACAPLDEAVALIGGYMNSYPLDLRIALANVTVAATSEGLATSWIFAFNEAHVKCFPQIPADGPVVGMTPLGIP